MKLHLKSIENQVLEKYLLPAEEIFEQSEVKELKLVDKNLWLSKIRAYEVEIQLLGNKVNAATCECAMFIQEGMCSHIVATLFAVRREKDKPKPRKKTRVRNTKNKKLTVSNILQNVNQEELLNFITAYARRDQQFTTALKARFAGAVQNVDLEEKYDQLLNTIIKSNQSANKTIQKPGAKKIHDIIEMLLNQAEEELIDNNYAEAFHITKNIIEKIHGILHQLNAHRNDITASLFRAFHQLSKLIAASIPPELNLQIVDFSISILQKRHFNIAKIEKAYYSFLLKICDHKDNFERILPSFDKELSRNFHNKDLESKVQLFRFGMLEKHGDPALFQSYFDSVKDRPWLLL